MPVHYIEYGPSGGGLGVDFINTPNAGAVQIDGSTFELTFGGATSGTTSKKALDNTTGGQTVPSPVVTGNAGSGMIFCKQAAFVEDATTLTHTATFTIPAGSLLLDIIFLSTVLWTGGGTVNFTCGDANSANGWFTNTNLKATDLLLGERLQASNANNWGGVNGAYLTTAGRFGQQSTNMIGGYCPTAYSVIMVITESAPSTTAGRSFGYVLWMAGQSVAPVLA